MTSGGPVDLFVDLAECARLHTAVRALVAELDALGERGTPERGPQALGDEVAASAERFVAAWRHGTSLIRDHLDACARMVEYAMQRYADTESALRAAATGAGPGAGS